MIKSRLVVGLVLIAMSWLCLPGTSCAPVPNFDSHLKAITRPYRFSTAKWELRALVGEVGKAFGRRDRADFGVSGVVEYFTNVEKIKGLESAIGAIKAGDHGDASREDELSRLRQQNAAAAGAVESLLEAQIREVLAQQGIFNPIIEYRLRFPPVDFRLESPPYLLVVSPRDRIESLREVTLLPGMTPESMEDIEDGVDRLGVSSLVVELGGLATYPNYITDRASLKFTLETAVHEWLHQYLAFKPLGFLYILDLTGLRQDYEIATMTETLVDMVSQEIGAMTYEKYYAQGEGDNAGPTAAGTGFDFNKEMREIRQAVDSYLARGEIEPAEQFMEGKRQFLASQGYHIRKLNQAYFAFYGTYADSPTSISPIGAEMKKLRSQSASLKEFLETAAAMTSRQDLADSIR